MTEPQLTNRLMKQLKDHGALIFSAVGSKMQPNGWPDRYVHTHKWRGWLEFKVWDGCISKIQEFVIEQLNARQRGSAWFVRFSQDEKTITIYEREGMQPLASCKNSGVELLAVLNSIR